MALFASLWLETTKNLFLSLESPTDRSDNGCCVEWKPQLVGNPNQRHTELVHLGNVEKVIFIFVWFLVCISVQKMLKL